MAISHHISAVFNKACVFPRTILFSAVIISLVVGCKQTSPLYSSELRSKLEAITLNGSDIYMLSRPDLEKDTFYETFLAAFQSPLSVPDKVQSISEELFAREDELFPVPPRFLEDVFKEKLSPYMNIRPTKLSRTLRHINRTYGSRQNYDNVLAWIKKQPPAVVSIMETLLKAAYKSRRSTERAFKDLSKDEIEELRQLIPKFIHHTVGDENTQGFDERLLSLSQRVRIKHLLDGTLSMLNAIEKTRAIYERDPEPIMIAERFTFETPLGAICIGSALDDTFTEPACIIIDFEGNDTYSERSGTNTVPLAPSVIIDLNGNDRYATHEDNSFAGGVMNIAVLFDRKGHDVYQAHNNACGSGIAGVGILIDHAGDDEYKINQFGIGAGAFGLGILYDKKGNDYYSGKHYCEGFSMTKGLGLLLDLYGNDFYSAGGEYQGWAFSEESYKSSSQGFSMGIREYAGGGLAFLLDGSGNDSYHGAALCQGTGYWFGLGVLHDVMGNDFYSSIHYAQGAGVHFGFGCLLDNEGADFYKSVAASQGLGYHRSVGMLVDYAGDDCYNAKRLSTGAASLTGIGLCNDKAGNDTYQVGLPGSTSLGTGTFDDTVSSIGLFFDEGGSDHYIHNRWFQNTDEIQPGHSLRSDGEITLGIFTKETLFIPKNAKPKKHFVDFELPQNDDPLAPEKLYAIISDPDASPKARLDASQMFLTLDERAVDFLLVSIRSQAFVRSLEFPARYIKHYEDELLPYFAKAVAKEKNDLARAKFILYMKFARNRSETIPLIRKQLKRKGAPLSLATSILVLTQLRDAASEESFIKLLKHRDPFVVLNAINAVATLQSQKAFSDLTNLLDHDYYVVRDSAATTLSALGDPAMEHLKMIYPEAAGIKKRMIEKIFDDYKNFAR
jgi:hypothetical protein